MSEVIARNHADSSILAGQVRPILVSAGLFMLVAGIGYPLVTTGVAQLLFQNQSRGSLIIKDGHVIGSTIIGQAFKKPDYFHPRPSATSGVDPADPSKSIAQPYNAANSGASNLGPTSKALIDQVTSRVQAYRRENGLAANAAVPVDAVTASGSGLDPDISLANAVLQAKRVAHARGVPVQEVLSLIQRKTTPRQLGILGDPRVNVLQLNLALDDATATSSSAK
jgi:K+-transporting ATPase ATPase C chain